MEPDGERTFVTMPGVEAELEAAELSAVRPGAGDLVSISGYDLAYPAGGAVLADWVDGLPPGLVVALDPGPLVREIPSALLARVLGRVGVLTMNQREARLLAGPSAERASGAELLSAVRRGSAMSAMSAMSADALVVVREGPDGCVATGAALGAEVLTVPAPRVTAVDTTGAGDTHTGVLLAALATGRSVAHALELANRAAAISVTRVGPATAPTAAELAAG